MLMTAWGADWPTGFGFLDEIVNGSAIKPSGGNNVQELNDPAINKALNDAIGNTDKGAREKAWGDIDNTVADNASAVPLIYRKNLLFRPRVGDERDGDAGLPRHVRLPADGLRQITGTPSTKKHERQVKALVPAGSRETPGRAGTGAGQLWLRTSFDAFSARVLLLLIVSAVTFAIFFLPRPPASR